MTPDQDLSARLAELDGVRFMSVLYEAYRSGQLIALADHNDAVQAAVAKAVEAEAALWMQAIMEYSSDGMAVSVEHVAAAIRSRGVEG